MRVLRGCKAREVGFLVGAVLEHEDEEKVGEQQDGVGVEMVRVDLWGEWDDNGESQVEMVDTEMAVERV